MVKKLFDHDHAYIFQNPDKRIIFAIPYEGEFTLIGTTDVEIQGAPDAARIDADETAYLCEQASRYFARPVVPADVVWAYSGVRPLLDDASGDASAVTRDYLLEFDGGVGTAAPLLTVWGGKITTFRKLAEDAADEVGRLLGEARPAWTEPAPLPGGDLRAWIGTPRRLARAYGARIDRVLGRAESLADLGAEVAPGLHEAEIRYLQREEWVTCADDLLWRRSKLGLHYSAAERQQVADWLAAHPLSVPPMNAPTSDTSEPRSETACN